MFENACSRTQCVQQGSVFEKAVLGEHVFENVCLRKAPRPRGTVLHDDIVYSNSSYKLYALYHAICVIIVWVISLCSITRLYGCVRKPVFENASWSTPLRVFVCSGLVLAMYVSSAVHLQTPDIWNR